MIYQSFSEQLNAAMGKDFTSVDIIRVFATNVKKHRIQKSLSQEALAHLSGLHRTYISDIECCQRNVSLENVQRIANALEIEPYCLLIDEKGKQ